MPLLAHNLPPFIPTTPEARHPPMTPAKRLNAAMKDIKTVQHRTTEELRAEDDIAGLKLDGKTVYVALHPRTNFTDKQVKHVVAEHLAKHGMKGMKLEVIRPMIEPRPDTFSHPAGGG